MRWAVVLLVLAGCGGRAGSNTSSGGFGIDVLNAEQHGSLGVVTPQAGRTFAVLRVSIANKSESRPVRANGALFSITTKGAISVPISGALGALTNPCADLSVAQGGQLTCGLAFEVPSTDAPATLVYDDGQGHAATSSIPAYSCAAAQWKGSACTSCVTNQTVSCFAVMPTSCLDELQCFASAVQASPAMLCTAPSSCGQSSKCQQELGSLAECVETRCASACGP